ncbi:MAG: protein kinase [Polyangia bacterium]
MSLAEGSLLGSYRVVRKIGEGGMGAVYEALNETIERRVALKVLHPELTRNKDIANRFINEARAVNRVSHPGIVQVFDYGQPPDGPAYIVMEYLEGERLSERMVHRADPLTISESIFLCRQIAAALGAAHERGIVHRDLKPDNIMIVADLESATGERTKLLDFGLAKLLDRPGTKSNVIMGTPQYMSPEQCRSNKQITDRSDTYSLGILLFEMLTQRLPFTEQSSGELIAAHLYQNPPSLATVASDLPPALTALVDRMLSKEPSARPAMTEVAESLAELSAQLPPPPTRRSLRPGPVRSVVVVASPQDAFLPTMPETPSASVGELRAARSVPVRRIGSAALVLVLVLALGMALLGRWWVARQPARSGPVRASAPTLPRPDTASPPRDPGADVAPAPARGLALPAPVPSSAPVPEPARTAAVRPAAPNPQEAAADKRPVRPAPKRRPRPAAAKSSESTEKMEYEE